MNYEMLVFEYCSINGKSMLHVNAYGDSSFSFLMDEGQVIPTGWGARKVPPGVSVPCFKIKPRPQPGLV